MNDTKNEGTFNGSLVLLKEVLEEIYINSTKKSFIEIILEINEGLKKEEFPERITKKKEKMIEIFKTAFNLHGNSKIEVSILSKMVEINLQFREYSHHFTKNSQEFEKVEERFDENLLTLQKFLNNFSEENVDNNLNISNFNHLVNKSQKLLVIYEELKNASTKSLSTSVSEFVKTVAIFTKNLISKLSPKNFTEFSNNNYIESLINVLQTIRMDNSLVENVNVRLDLIILSQDIVFSFSFLVRFEQKFFYTKNEDSEIFSLFRSHLRNCKTEITKFLKIIKEITKTEKPKINNNSKSSSSSPPINSEAKKSIQQINILNGKISLPLEVILQENQFDKNIISLNYDKKKFVESFTNLGKKKNYF